MTTSSSLMTPQRRYNVLGRLSWNLTDNTSLTMDVRHSRSWNRFPWFGDHNRGTGLKIGVDNAFLPTAVRDAVLAASETSFGLGRPNDDVQEIDQATAHCRVHRGAGWRDRRQLALERLLQPRRQPVDLAAPGFPADQQLPQRGGCGDRSGQRQAGMPGDPDQSQLRLRADQPDRPWRPRWKRRPMSPVRPGA